MLPTLEVKGESRAIVNFMFELQSEHANVFSRATSKRRKTDPQNHSAERKVVANSEPKVLDFENSNEFRICLPDIDLHSLRESIITFSQVSNQGLFSSWEYIKNEDSIFTSMTIHSERNNSIILKNECIVMNNEFEEDNTTKIQTDNQFLTAIAYAAHIALVDVSNVRLSNSSSGNSLSLYMDFQFSMKPEHKRKATDLITTLSKLIKVGRSKYLREELFLNTQEGSFQNQILSNRNVNLSSSNASIYSPQTVISAISQAANSSESLEGQGLDTQQKFYAEIQLLKSPNQTNMDLDRPFPHIPETLSIEDFYRFIQPPVYEEYLEHYISDTMASKLTPFQTQNVQWMISREGHFADPDGRVLPNPEIYQSLPLLYGGSHTSETQGNYFNLYTDKFTSDRSEISSLISKSFKGGLLADEMGLGKTVSVLGLITAHTWSPTDIYHPKQENYSTLTVVKATLIISPASIIHQWKSEIKKHTPNLKVFVYQGRRIQPDIESKDFEGYDIVLTHYEAFRSEIHYVKPRTKRPRRSGVEYKHSYSLSPLVSALWFRCVLDEAQMIEAPLTNVSSVARLIPRWYSWVVTGTPIKNKFSDLYGLYNFLSLENTLHSEKIFRVFCHDPRFKPIFYEFMRATARRNMKVLLKKQIYIPKQTRHIVKIPFTTIEQHYYDDLWRSCRAALNLDWMDNINWTLPENANETTIKEYNDIKQKMRLWLLALRQNCVHPSMIGNNSLRLNQQNYHSNANFQSLDDVLNDMAKNAQMTLNNHQHSYYQILLKISGMYELIGDWSAAKNNYELNMPFVEAITNAVVERIKTFKLNIGGEKDEMPEDFLKMWSPVLSRWHILLHQYYFYMAGLYHRQELQDLENVFYSKAANIRRILLENHTVKVKNHLQELEKISSKIQFTSNVWMGCREFDSSFVEAIHFGDNRTQDLGEENEGPAEKSNIINSLQNTKSIGDILDRQYEKILYIRKKIIPMLSEKLVDSNENESDEIIGDEYDKSLTQQEVCQIYLSAYQALLQDRKFIIKGSQIPLSDLIASEDNGEYVSKEAKAIQKAEEAFRKGLNSPVGFKIECLKDTQYTLKQIKSQLETKGKTREDVALLIKNEQDHLKSKIQSQSKLIDDLDADFKKLSELFNSRVAYYKYLQQISDTLLDWKSTNPSAELKKLEVAKSKHEDLISQAKSRNQYFKALIGEHKSQNSEKEEGPKECLICQDTFDKGIITYCGHISCADCGTRWFAINRRCHTCKSTVKLNDWYNVSYKNIEMQEKEQVNNIGDNPNKDEEYKKNQIKLNKLITEINKQEIIEGKGAKLDSIIRHIQHIKMSNNGKCIVFSQWTKVLDMLKHGLSLNNIGYTVINSGAALNKNNVTEFQNNPNINVILLHARSQSSGLTLVAAQTVFIVEPVINESIEKQAINRIHRIGQTKEVGKTSVFWYIIQDTIEERIQAIHDMKRSNKASQLLVPENEKHELSKLSEGGGEYVSNEDLRRCFTNNEAFALQ